MMVRLRLEQLLQERGISRYRLVRRYDSEVLSRICAALHCEIGDILEYCEEDQTE